MQRRTMPRRTVIAGAAAATATLGARGAALAQSEPATPAGAANGGSDEMATRTPETGYAPVNGLRMYYEIHGEAVDGRPPLLLLHGGFMSISTSFGPMIPRLAERRRVIAVEQQGHGHTADVDRPLTFEQEADDTAAALRHLGVARADVFGYSDGGNVGLGLAIRHPELVRKLAVAGTNVTNDGLVPGTYDFMAGMTPEMLGDELRAIYEAEAARPEDWPTLVAKIRQQVIELKGWTAEQLRGIAAPTLLAIGDADIVTPEHALELVRAIPGAHLAVLPMRDHIQLATQPGWMLAIMEEFFAAPISEGR